MENKNIKSISFLIFSLFLLVLLLSTKVANSKVRIERNFEPPKAEKIKKELSIHGHTRIDYYYWLNERENPKVIGLLKAENCYKDEILAHTSDLQKKIFSEITGRIKRTDVSVPNGFQGYLYYTRYEGDNEYPHYCRKKDVPDGKEEILLDVNAMAKEYAFFYVTHPEVRPDNNMIAFGVDKVSRGKFSLYFKNLKSGEISKETISDTTGNAVWANDNLTVFYEKLDHTLRSFKVYRHVIGTDVSTDKEIYHEEDPTFGLYVSKSKSKKYIFIVSYHTLSTEYRYLDASTPEKGFKVIHKREKGIEYDVEHYLDKFLIKTNYLAKNFRLMETPIHETSKKNWKEVVPHRENVFLEKFEIFKDFLVLAERIKGLTNLRIIRWDGNDDHAVDFKESTYMINISKNPELDTDRLRFEYSSLTIPDSTFEYNISKKEKTLLKQKEVLGNFDSQNYFSERVSAIAGDKTMIPISLVYRKDLFRDGENPLLLYGYGSYGSSTEPFFSIDRLSLLDRGFIYAIAHIRGGQELGRQWYEDGKLLKKKNTFTDFIDCAKFLIERKFTHTQKLFAMGRSAGGLLMGAVVNMRPDLFRGIVTEVPWVDVVTTMLDSSIPLTMAEYDEWGDPGNKEFYDYMLSYSPYDNVRVQNYPSIFITTGFHDGWVQYFEPLKWVQKLREMNISNNLIVLHVNLEGGHGGISGRFRKYYERAQEYAFMLDLLGIKK